MHIVVVDAGVVGVTTAYYLARGGHDVTVVERLPEPALGCSYANGGLINAYAASPWSAPGIPMTVLKEFWRHDAPYRVGLRLDPAMAVWIGRFFANCTSGRTRTIKAHLRRLSHYSFELMREIRDLHEVLFDHGSAGLIYLFRHAAALEAAERVGATSEDPRGRPERLSAGDFLEIEPSLAGCGVRYAGALRYAHDETGDARSFSAGVARAAAEHGAIFRYGEEVVHLQVAGNRVRSVRLADADIACDGVVVASGVDAVDLVAPYGIRLPMYPVKGYSVTATARNPAVLPRHALQDAERKITLTPLGNRVRAAGTAELAGRDARLNRKRAAALLAHMRNLLPDLSWDNEPEAWAGLRPMTADSLPVLGATHVDGLWLNTCHGSFGFTIACGAGRIVADLVSGNRPVIGLDGLGFR